MIIVYIYICICINIVNYTSLYISRYVTRCFLVHHFLRRGMYGWVASHYSNSLYVFLQFQSLKPGSSLLLTINSSLLDSFQIISDKIYSTYLKIASPLTHSLS